MTDPRESAAKGIALAKKRLQEEIAKQSEIESFLVKYPENVLFPAEVYHCGSPLYGCSIWLEYGHTVGLSLRETVDLMRDLPPVDAAMWSDGCRYITPRAFAKAQKASDLSTYREILGFRLVLESPSYAAPSCVLTWWAQIGEELCKVSCEMAHPFPVEFLVEWTRYGGGHGEIDGIKHKRVVWQDEFSTPGEHFIYAGGGPKDPGRLVAYWIDGANQDMPPWEAWASIIGDSLLSEEG